MHWTNIINCFLTLGVVIFACLQWKCSNMQRKTQLFKYRIRHIQELKEFRQVFCQNMDYVSGVRAKYIIPKDYSNEYEKIFKFLDEHLAFTSCYFDKELQELEKEFISLIKEILPAQTEDITLCDIGIDKFQYLCDKYEYLFQTFVDKINS